MGLWSATFSDPEYGLHGCCPAEILHCFYAGMAERAINICYGTKRVIKGKRQGTRQGTKRRLPSQSLPDLDQEDGDEPDSNLGDRIGHVVYDEEDDLNVSKTLKVFTDAVKKVVDECAIEMHGYLKWQSETKLPRTRFPNGLSSLPKMQGHERSGVLLVMFIIFVMDVPGYDKAFDEFWRKHPSTKKENVHPNLSASDWGYLTQAIGYDRMMCMIKTLSLMLLFEAFMKCP